MIALLQVIALSAAENPLVAGVALLSGVNTVMLGALLRFAFRWGRWTGEVDTRLLQLERTHQ